MPEPIQSAGNQNDNVAASQAPSFTITIKTDSHTFSGAGLTALDAMRAVRPPSLDLIGSGSVTITRGNSMREMYYSGIQLKRLLNPENQPYLVQELAQGM